MTLTVIPRVAENQNCIVATRLFSLYIKLIKEKVMSVKTLTSYSITHYNSVVKVWNSGRDLRVVSTTQRIQSDRCRLCQQK